MSQRDAAHHVRPSLAIVDVFGLVGVEGPRHLDHDLARWAVTDNDSALRHKIGESTDGCAGRLGENCQREIDKDAGCLQKAI